MPVNFERKERSESHDSKNFERRKENAMSFQMHEKCKCTKLCVCVGGGGGGGGGLNL